MKKTVYFLLIVLIALSCGFFGCKNNEEKDANTEFTLNVATYNIERGNEVNLNFDIIAEDITKFGIDLVGFQEIDEMTQYVDRRSPIRELAEKTGLQYFHFTNVTATRPGYIGNAFLSRYPIVSVEDFMFDTGDNYYKRGYCHAVLNVNGNFVHYYNTHLTHNSEAMVIDQETLIKEKTKSNPRFIVTADFNDLHFNYCNIFNTETHVNTPEHTYLTAATKQDDGSFIGTKPLDNIIASGNATLINAGIYNEVAHSDHFMLYCTLHFAKI